MQKIIAKYRPFFMPLIILMLIIILTISFVQPKISEIASLRQKTEVNKVKLDNLTQKAGLLSSLDQNQLRLKFKTLESALPSEKDIPGFLVAMQKIANEASVSVDKVELSAGSISTPSAQAQATTAKSMQTEPDLVSAKVTITGTFTGLRQFLDKASQARRLLNIKGVSLGSNAAQKASGPISLELIFSIYYQLLPTSLGEIASPLPQVTSDEDRIYQTVAKYPLYSTFEEAGSLSVPVGKSDPFH